ncbi:hypothetical protein BT96DRAFT_936099 [Gymnopus androsaceus JB14]|uniref:Uncharacterized protein n=1 Tax=Gymnopus androsaceus JB14 TaxID=1447944 RepID=A0A6A4HX16_9AGAR|nr:hypothetical protein BT96DRAFT_936099 [Gymnopus androsaceus JB14]
MTNVGNQPQSGEGATFLPALPPSGSEMPEVTRVSIAGLQTIFDQVVKGNIIPDIGRRNMCQYLQNVFDKFNLHRSLDLGESLKSWFESIDDHEQRMHRAEREGARRGRAVPRLPGIEEILAGSAFIAPNRPVGGGTGQNPSGRYGVDPPAPDRGSGRTAEGERVEEENAGGDTRAIPARRT